MWTVSPQEHSNNIRTLDRTSSSIMFCNQQMKYQAFIHGIIKKREYFVNGVQQHHSESPRANYKCACELSFLFMWRILLSQIETNWHKLHIRPRDTLVKMMYVKMSRLWYLCTFVLYVLAHYQPKETQLCVITFAVLCYILTNTSQVAAFNKLRGSSWKLLHAHCNYSTTTTGFLWFMS